MKLINSYSCLEACGETIKRAGDELINCFEQGGKLLVCGNGGSCADSEHIVGELMKGFLKKRSLPSRVRAQMKEKNPDLADSLLDSLQGALPAISLTGLPALSTAFSNDVDPQLVFAQQVNGLGKQGDVFLGISTSGNSNNVYAAAQVAKSLGLTVISLTGQNSGKLGDCADIAITVPEIETYRVQELHLPVYHAICAMVEEHFFKD